MDAISLLHIYTVIQINTNFKNTAINTLAALANLKLVVNFIYGQFGLPYFKALNFFKMVYWLEKGIS